MSAHIFDISGTTGFAVQVIEASIERPVAAVFYLPGCGTCSTVLAQVEQFARRHDGKIGVARVDVSKETRLAAQYHIHGVPALKLFREGIAINEFAGNLPTFEIRKRLRRALPTEADDWVNRGTQLLQEYKQQDAEHAFRTAVQVQAGHPRACMEMARLMFKLGRHGEARQWAMKVDPAFHRLANPLLYQLEFIKNCQALGGHTVADSFITAQPDNPSAHLSMACCLAAEEKYTEALELMLKTARLEEFETRDAVLEMAAKIFAILGPGSPVTKIYRDRFSPANL